MRKPFGVLRQYLVPQHAFSRALGRFSNCRWPWVKNWAIRTFIRRYGVDMRTAIIEDPKAYPTFNAFFTRYLKPQLRPIAFGPNDIASPVDGCVSQSGRIHHDQIFQAKGFQYDLSALLGGDTVMAKALQDGYFATIYLAPKDYHRVHMPLDGKLIKTISVPGKLFSVNPQTVCTIPNLFSRNERLICLFDTASGPMVVILVGAIIVSGIYTVWDRENESTVQLKKGEELGHFKVGSTVIVLFAKDKVSWASYFKEKALVKMGQGIGHCII